MNDLAAHVYVVEGESDPPHAISTLVQRRDSETHRFGSTEEFLASGPHRRPGCLIADETLPSLSAEQLQDRLSEDQIPLPLIIITADAKIPRLVRMMEKGAITLLVKPVQRETLDQYISQAIDLDACQTRIHRRFHDLKRRWLETSERQREVLDSIVRGFPNKVIARRLDVSQRTIEIERSRLLSAFEVESTPELVALATEFRLLSELRFDLRLFLRKHETSFGSDKDDTTS